MPWTTLYINSYFLATTIQKDEVVWFQVEYLRELQELLAWAFEIRSSDSIYLKPHEKKRGEIFINTLNNYLTWCAVRRYINYASKPYRNAYETFIKELSGGKPSNRRWI